MVESAVATRELYCRQCDIIFSSRSKLNQHFSLYHDDLPSDGTLPSAGTLTSYLESSQKEPEYRDHDFCCKNLQCPNKCSVCGQVIWEVAVWCPACKIRCHRLCSERVSPKCLRLSPKVSKKPKDHPGSARGFDLLRRKVGENKMRYVDEKYDLDLSYISPRIIAMSFPAQGIEAAYRNKVKDVANLLESKHQDKYLIINVSDRSYDTDIFKNQVVEFGWPDHHAPTMSTLICIVKTMDSWLKQDADHVIVVHCKGGKGRTGVAIAAYLQYCYQHLSAKEALEKFADKRFYDETTGGVTQPAQRRMVHYFGLLVKNEVQLEPRQLVISRLVLFGCPLIDGKRGAKILFCIYEGFKLVHQTKVYGVTPDHEHVQITFENLQVQSDAMIKAFHIGKTRNTCILRVQFHTAFVRDDYSEIIFRKKDIDIACRDDRFPEDGILQVTFRAQESDMTDNAESTIHRSLIADNKEAKELEEMTKEVSLMSFNYDFSAFYTDNPLSEMKQNEMLDGILMLHDDYKLITPLLPFSSSPPPPASDQDSGKGESPPNGGPPPLPPKSNKKCETSPKSSSLSRSKKELPKIRPCVKSKEVVPDNVARPALPPRGSARPPPPENANILTSYLVESKEEAGYLSFEIATPVRNLVQHFEQEEENQTFTDWVKFDDDDEEDDDALIDLKSPKPEDCVKMRCKAATIDGSGKSKLALTRSEPEGHDRRSDSIERKHATVGRKTKSLELDCEEASETAEKKSGRKSCYVPYLKRKESIKKDKSGNKKYIPYKIRTDSLGTNSRSSSESSTSFLSPPPLPPRGDKAAPGPSTLASPFTDTPAPDSDDNLQLPARRLNSLSKSMDNLQSSNNSNVSLALESDPLNKEFSHKMKIIRQTRDIWLRPNFNREESQATLVTQCPGAFIIRMSNTHSNCYGLTMRLDDGANHQDFNLHPNSYKVSNFLIEQKENGRYYINGYDSRDFETVEDLVEYFTNHSGGLPRPLCIPTQPYSDRIEAVVPMLLRNVSFPVFILEKRCIRYLPLDSFEADNVKTLLTETLTHVEIKEIRLISMSVTKHGVTLIDPECKLFDVYDIPYKQIKNCEVGARDQTVTLPDSYICETANTFGLIHRDKDSEIIYIALAEYEDRGLSITKTINKFRSYLV